ncbi:MULTISPECIES: thiamine phosphate synthase [Fusobacterium]|uniref:Thiamine-phosphate synthase n=1 Tax=Fusobacterium hominis TaxID=2764326 RepID=A0A7G9GYK9_9FUSO|nr:MULTISPECIES: thiamine phosphate synthase [Fusobacterium]QNM15891.1 thiamine phosphate synthase [Fusobacterium hominis]
MRKRIVIPKGLYGITGEKFANGKSNYQCVKEMIDGGIKIVQYREKDKTMREMIKEAIEISNLCKEKEVLFIVNDHIDLAILTDADGVHVGQDDMAPKDIRKLIGDNKIIGLSTHSIEQAQSAYKDINVDYIGVGPIFPTTTKDAKPVGLEYLDYVSGNLDIPFVAIGGIKTSNIDKIISRNAHSICMVSEVVKNNNICEFVKKYQELLNK